MIRKAATLILALVISLTVALYLSPSQTSTAPAILLPTPTATLPVCVTEDGAGMALCTWDAQTQGNGQGTSVVSGDCAPSVMGEASALCVNLHSRASVTVPNEDGSSNTIPNGADLVGECTDEFDKGMERQECIKAQFDS
jgi:hypothetical protein